MERQAGASGRRPRNRRGDRVLRGPRTARGRAAIRAVLLSLCVLPAGCSQGRMEIRGEERPSTLGTDRATVPPGQTITPPSLGVDLVSGPSPRAESGMANVI